MSRLEGSVSDGGETIVGVRRSKAVLPKENAAQETIDKGLVKGAHNRQARRRSSQPEW